MNATERIARGRSCGRQGCPCARWKPGGNVHCPCHNDRSPSLSLNTGDNGQVLVYDHAGCSQEAIIEALKERGLWPEPSANGSKPEQPVAYEYHAADGSVWGRVHRRPGKEFPVQRPGGNGGWLWGWTDKETGQALVTRTLYRLPKLLSADTDAWVFVVEGEKDADRLAGLGLVATTNPGGAGKWRDEYSDTLKGRKVAIIADHDDAGLKHAHKVAESIAGKAAAVRVVELPAKEIGDDVSDWLDRGGTVEGLLAKAEAAPHWSPGRDVAPGLTPTRLRAERLDDLLDADDEPFNPIICDRGEGAILTEKGKGCIAAGAGVGKTNMLLCGARHLCAGEDFLGFPIPKPRRVLYLMLEGSRRATKRRLRKAWAGSDPEARARFHIGHVALDLTDTESLAALYALLDDVQPEVLIIDPLRNAHPGDENSSQDMTRLTGILDGIIERWSCAILLAHHDRKRPPFVRRDAGADRLRGSTAFTGWLSFALSLDPDPSGEDRLVAEWVKTRDAESPLPPLSLDFDRQTLDFIPADREPEGKVSDDAILNAVFHQGGTARGPELVQGFVEGAGASDRWVRERIRALVKDGKLEEYIADADRRSGAKSYRLPGESLWQENDG